MLLRSSSLPWAFLVWSRAVWAVLTFSEALLYSPDCLRDSGPWYLALITSWNLDCLSASIMGAGAAGVAIVEAGAALLVGAGATGAVMFLAASTALLTSFTAVSLLANEPASTFWPKAVLAWLMPVLAVWPWALTLAVAAPASLFVAAPVLAFW